MFASSPVSCCLDRTGRNGRETQKPCVVLDAQTPRVSLKRVHVQMLLQFSALTEVLFGFLTEPKEVERFLTQLSDFATMNKISLGPLKNIVKSILLVPNGLSEEKASYFAEQWKLNVPTLTRLAVGQTLMINQLIDMEWKFGVTAGSSELEKVGSIFLQLKLVIKKGSQMENVYVELTLPQFYSFLHEMERAKTTLESFS
uniref:COMM domain-containing protein n=1 Tax=Meleagris gallopavo TaxID=9103 RepID=A0A803YF83_MELGA